MRRNVPWLRGQSEATQVVFDAARRSGVVLGDSRAVPTGGASASALLRQARARRAGSPSRTSAAISAAVSADQVDHMSPKEYARHLLRLQVSAKHRSRSPGTAAVSAVSRVIAAATRPRSPSGPALNVPTAPRRKASPRPGARLSPLPRDPDAVDAPSPKKDSTTARGDSPAPSPKVVPIRSAKDEASKDANATADAPTSTDFSKFFTAQKQQADADADDAKPMASPATPATPARPATSSKPLDFGEHAAPKQRVTAATSSMATIAAADKPSSTTAQKDTAAEKKPALTPQQEAEEAASVWAELRSQELKAQRSAQEDLERRREQEARERTLKEQEAEWLASRTSPEWKPASQEYYDFVHGVHTAGTWERSFYNFSKTLGDYQHRHHQEHHHASRDAYASTMPKGSVTHAIGNLKIAGCPPAAAVSALSAVKKVAATHRIPDAAWRATQLRLTGCATHGSFAEFNAAFSAVPQSEWYHLPLKILRRAVTGTLADYDVGGWARACDLISKLHTGVHDPFCTMEMQLIRRLRTGGNAAGRERLFELTQTVERTLRGKLSELGKAHLVTLMYAYGRCWRAAETRRLYNEIAQRNELDETVSAAMLRFSHGEQSKALLAEMAARGVDTNAGVIAVESARSLMSRRDPEGAMTVIEDYRARRSLSDGWSPRLLLALSALALSGIPAERVLEHMDAGVRALYERPEQAPPGFCRVYVATLADAGRFEDAVELFDALAPEVKTTFGPTTGPKLNAAMRALGRPEVEHRKESGDGADESSVQPTFATKPTSQKQASQTGSDDAAGTGAAAAESTVQLQQADELLELARERQWESALGVLQSIDPGMLAAASPKQVTLLYNCALSAAVDVPEVVDSVLQAMDETGVQRNTTTYNTAMSAYARDAERWPDAVTLFNERPVSERDNSTYSVILAVYGKRGLWQEATSLFTEARESKAKLNPAQYSLVIQASFRHTWQTSLAAFCDLRQKHGAEAVKELVLNRVITALESNGRDADAARVHEAMKNKGKKGGAAADGSGKKKKKKASQQAADPVPSETAAPLSAPASSSGGDDGF